MAQGLKQSLKFMALGVVVLSGVTMERVSADEAPFSVQGAQTISTEQAAELYQKQATFIDVRSRDKWQWGHIQGASHFGLRSTFALLRHPGFIERGRPVVIYSNGSHTMRSALAAYMAASWGYEKIYYYRDGFFAWQAQDYPIKSAKRSALEAVIMQPRPE